MYCPVVVRGRKFKTFEILRTSNEKHIIIVRLGQEPWKALLDLRGGPGWAKMTSSAMTSRVQYTFEST